MVAIGKRFTTARVALHLKLGVLRIALMVFIIAATAMQFAECVAVCAASADETVPYTSRWGDFKTVVPDVWKDSIDFEGVNGLANHYTNTTFTSPDSHCLMSIRWYKRYFTHRQVNGELEMYSGPDDFVRQHSNRYGAKNLIEPVHEITFGGKKAQRFVGQFEKVLEDSELKTWRAKMGGLMFRDDMVENGGRQAVTVVETPSGFYVLAYFAPVNNYGKYEKYYDQMVTSFEPKDGPVMAENGKSNETTSKNEPPKSQFETLVDIFKSKRNKLFTEPLTIKAPDYACNADMIDCKTRVSSGWFADVSSQREILNYASTMTPAPEIPESAKRYFIKGTALMKGAKDVSDFNDAVKAYEEALLEAPWWGNAWFNLGVALEKSGWHEDAKEAIKLYLLTNPSASDKEQAQQKIYEIEAQQELQKKREDAVKAKYGGWQGNAFGFDALFRYGAIVQKMNFDASGNERIISLKIVTRKEDGYLLNYFYIADITSQNDILGRKFSMDWRGTQNFYLDDRTNPNKEYMTFSVTSYGDGDANITLGPAANASASIRTSLTTLLRERGNQAVYAGATLKIGGKEFYSIGQGGSKGSLLFFPAEMKGLLEHGSARDLMPAFVANVSYRGSDGTNKNYTNTDLGTVSGKHYHLEFTNGYWESMEGQGEDH